jgi:hypothetical protein
MAKDKTKDAGLGTVFTCQSEDANSVYLAGNFNDWNPEATPMTRADSGTWQIALALEPGRYEYKCVVDGGWCCEPGRDDYAGCSDCVRDDSGVHCETCVANSFGTMNRVLEVAASRVGQAA